jgi:hypothetical protein
MNANPPARPRANPLLDLPEERRRQLFKKLRECPLDDEIQEMLCADELPGVTRAQVMEFFRHEAENHWTKRIERAGLEADAIVRLAEGSSRRISSAILAALGQEAFRQIASGDMTSDAMNRMAAIFLRARADDREDQIHLLKHEQLRQDLLGRINLALEKFSEEIERHPGLRALFDELQRELSKTSEEESK